MKITTLVIIAMLVLVPVVAAQDIVSERGETSVRIYPGEAIFGAPSGTVVIETQIDGERFIGADVNIQSDDTVKYTSTEKQFFIFPDPEVQQLYEYKDDGSLEDTVYLKTKRALSYHVELIADSYLIENEDGSYKVVNPNVNETTEGYITISKPVGTDAVGQMITNITYTLNGDVLEVNLPKNDKGDDGEKISYPIAIDPILEHKYDLKLLLHANLEPPLFSTSDFRDSSRYFMMPYGNGIVNVNTTYAKYGNASFFTANSSSITVPNSSEFTFGTNNFSISAWKYYPVVPTTLSDVFFDHNESASNQDSFVLYSPSVLAFYSKRGGVNINTLTTAIPEVTPGTWHHFAFIQNGVTGRLYVDGVAVGGTVTRSGSLTALKANVNVSAPRISAGSHTDEVVVINGGMAASITELYAGGEWPLYLNGTFGGYADDDYTKSLLHFNGINGGTGNFTDQFANRSWTVTSPLVMATNSSKFGLTGAFFGRNGYITTPYSADFDMGTGAFTIDAWVSLLDSPFSSARLVYAGKYPFGYMIQVAPNGIAFFSNSSGTWATDASATSTITTGTKYHIAIVRNGTSIRFFKDGMLVETDTIPAGYQYNSYLNTTAINGYNCTVDELRVSKGIARWETNFTPPVTPYELITNVTTPSADPTGSGTIPATIAFINGVPSSAWTENDYYWSFGDGDHSTDENPSHTYTSSGIYTVSYDVSNNNMSYTSPSLTVQIGAPYVDFSCSPLAGTAALQVVCTDLTTNITPITSYVFDWGDGTGTTSPPNANNQWTHVYSTYGAFSPNLTETNSIGTGYKYKRDYIITSTNQNQQQTWYSPHQVSFKVIDRNKQAVVGATINATSDQSTLPGGLAGSIDSLTNMYGIRPEQAQQMIDNATIMSGTTAEDGRITFTMHSSIRYTLNMTDPVGYEYSKTIYPSDTNYIISMPHTGTYISPDATNNTYASIGNSTVTFIEPNSSYITLGVDYLDISGRTSALSFYTKFVQNNTYISWTNVSVTGAQHVLINKTYANVRGEQWRWGYLATRTV